MGINYRISKIVSYLPKRVIVPASPIQIIGNRVAWNERHVARAEDISL